MGQTTLQLEDLPHYTYDDYAQWEGRWEVIRGIPYAMTPSPRKKHQFISLKIASQLDALLANCNDNCTTYQAIDWQIKEDTVVQPDVLVVCDDNTGEIKLEIPPVLVFEILSPATSRKDRVLKYQLYQEAGVKYYCIVDPGTDSVEVFQLKMDIYHIKDAFEAGKMIFEIGKCRIEFDFSKIFSK